MKEAVGCFTFGGVLSYIGETNRHFNARVNEHLFRDKNSHIFKHLCASKGCKDKCNISCFKIIDHASTYSQLKINQLGIEMKDIQFSVA